MKRSIFLPVLVFGFLAGNLYGQESLLEKAYAYYEKEDYADAKEVYIQVLGGGKFTGETLYRYTYSMEMVNGINSDVLDLYAASWWYLTMDGSNEQYLERSKNKLESNSYSLDTLTWGKAQELAKNHIKANKIKYSPLKNITNTLRPGKSNLIILLIVSIIIYGIAIPLSRKTNCIIIWGFDIIPVAIVGLIFMYYLLDTGNKIHNDTFVNIIFFGGIITSFILSVIGNLRYGGAKWPMFAIVSILAKIILMFIIPIILAAYIFILLTVKKDRRYKDGTRDNVKTRRLGILQAIYIFLVVSFVKTGKKININIKED